MKQADKVQRWLHGAKFLHEKEEGWCRPKVNFELSDGDPEVVKVVHACSVQPDDILDALEKRISKWIRMKRVMTVVLLFIKKVKESRLERLKSKKVFVPSAPKKLTEKELREAEMKIVDKFTVEDIQEAETTIIRMAQAKSFKQEISELLRQSSEGKASKSRKKSLRKIYKLNPFIEDGILKVGGRLSNSTECDRLVKFPVILPRKALVSQRIVESYHKSIHHGVVQALLTRFGAVGIG